MIKKIPAKLFKLYSLQGFNVSFYVRLRWRLCPFEDIETHVPKEGKILDIGCGYGLLANYLALTSKKRDITGIDLSEKRIDIARKSIFHRQKISFHCKNVVDLQIGEYRAMIMSDFLHHIDYGIQEELLRLCYQKLQPGGLLLIEEVDDSPFWKYWLTYITDVLLNIGDDLFFRNRDSYKELLCRIGFEVHMKEANKNIPWSDILYICKKPQ